jgi:hypothetical protein
MCSAVFITELDPEFAAENVGYFTSPYAQRAKVGTPLIDRENKAVHVTLPSGLTRAAKYLGDQGCVTLPIGQASVSFIPQRIESQLPDPSTEPWPMGDVLPNDPLPAEIDAGVLQDAIDAAFEPATGMTAAFVVTWKGRLSRARTAANLNGKVYQRRYNSYRANNFSNSTNCFPIHDSLASCSSMINVRLGRFGTFVSASEYTHERQVYPRVIQAHTAQSQDAAV